MLSRQLRGHGLKCIANREREGHTPLFPETRRIKGSAPVLDALPIPIGIILCRYQRKKKPFKQFFALEGLHPVYLALQLFAGYRT
jgi:hypothetical protein